MRFGPDVRYRLAKRLTEAIGADSSFTPEMDDLTPELHERRAALRRMLVHRSVAHVGIGLGSVVIVELDNGRRFNLTPREGRLLAEREDA